MYRVGKVIGEGSFAKVRAARHKLTGQKVVVKTYDRSAIKDVAQWRRVRHEGRIMERLRHPRIVRLYESIETSRHVHLVMELVAGPNLCTHVKRRRRLGDGEARRVFDGILQGLEYMHGMDVCHRDVKLENVLMDVDDDAGGVASDSGVKLADFGFSACVRGGRRLHVFCGTPSYMPPEIVRRGEYDGKPADVWSLGVVLYALLCGCFPFSGATYPELYQRIQLGHYRLPTGAVPGAAGPVSPAAADLLRGMLVADPARRFTLRQVRTHPWMQTLAAS
ncbi:unnamed protein product, partial [Phaeothamnion confervicola]